MTYNESPITLACAKKMKEVLNMLIQEIWDESPNLNQSDPFGACGITSCLKLIILVQIKDLGPNNVIESKVDTLSPEE